MQYEFVINYSNMLQEHSHQIPHLIKMSNVWSLSYSVFYMIFAHEDECQK